MLEEGPDAIWTESPKKLLVHVSGVQDVILYLRLWHENSNKHEAKDKGFGLNYNK